MRFGELTGQGWLQIGELGLAFVLSALIGVEREIRQKSAGLRTYTLVGLAAALIMLVSKYGFGDVLSERVVLDPSRIAAQIVTGIGFIGGGLIFVRRDSVRGLTTAAIVWLTAAVGMACGGPADSRAVRHRPTFLRRIRVSCFDGTVAQVPLDSLVAASHLRRRQGNIAGGARRLHAAGFRRQRAARGA